MREEKETPKIVGELLPTEIETLRSLTLEAHASKEVMRLFMENAEAKALERSRKLDQFWREAEKRLGLEVDKHHYRTDVKDGVHVIVMVGPKETKYL